MDSEPPQKITLEESRAFLRTRYPILGEIADDLEGRGLKLIRFHQAPYQGRMCGSLKFSSSGGDYILQFALQPSEAMLFRCDGQGGVIPVGFDELSIEGLAGALMKPPADQALALICGDDQELAILHDVTETWLANHYPGLSDEQRLAMARAIFEEATHDLRRTIPAIVEGVLERYGFVPPSRRAKPLAALSE